MPPYPPMRMIEVIPFEHEGKPMIQISDPEGLMEYPVAVPMEMAMVMSLLDGNRGGPEVQQELARLSGGHIMPLEQIERLVKEMDARYLLVNERTLARLQEIESAYDALPSRAAAHAGGSYAADPEGLITQFDGYFSRLSAIQSIHRPRGLVVPHIDFRVGGESIAKGLAALDAKKPFPLYIILGVAHRPTRNLFTLTDKPFETPLGMVEVDLEAAARLRELYGAEQLSGAIAHKHEHSVEFQAVALKYFHREATTPFKILPILCGSLHEFLHEKAPAPESEAVVGDFIAALRTLLNERAGEVCVIASVDLSHVGRKFDEENGVDDFRAQLVEAADGRMLDHVVALDADGFFDHFRPDANQRNVDAVTAVYVMLKALAPADRGELLEYKQWREHETDSMVTFASLAIY